MPRVYGEIRKDRGSVLNVLVACEESQAVCKAFRARGHRAFSCDIQDCSGGHPEWHIKGDVLPLLNGNCTFTTADTHTHTQRGRWDLIIAHPPCTYLSNVATRSHSIRMTPLEKINRRTMKRIEAMLFFMVFVNADCDKIAIENPVGVMNTCYRAADQIVQPFEYAPSTDSDEYVTKATCLWLKGLDPLVPTNQFERPNNREIFGVMPSGKAKTWEDSGRFGGVPRQIARSKTFRGIAEAMADQRGDGYGQQRMDGV